MTIPRPLAPIPRISGSESLNQFAELDSIPGQVPADPALANELLPRGALMPQDFVDDDRTYFDEPVIRDTKHSPPGNPSGGSGSAGGGGGGPSTGTASAQVPDADAPPAGATEAVSWQSIACALSALAAVAGVGAAVVLIGSSGGDSSGGDSGPAPSPGTVPAPSNAPSDALPAGPDLTNVAEPPSIPSTQSPADAQPENAAAAIPPATTAPLAESPWFIILAACQPDDFGVDIIEPEDDTGLALMAQLNAGLDPAIVGISGLTYESLAELQSSLQQQLAGWPQDQTHALALIGSSAEAVLY